MRKHKSVLNKLTKKELVHVLESICDDPVRKILTIRKKQEKLMRFGNEPCLECKHIAMKLKEVKK